MFIFFLFLYFLEVFLFSPFFGGGGLKTGGVLWHLSITFHKREARNCFNPCSTRSVDYQQTDCEGICSEWSRVKHKTHKQPGAIHHYHICSACEQLGVLGIRELQLLPKSLPLIYFFYYCNQNIESCYISPQVSIFSFKRSTKNWLQKNENQQPLLLMLITVSVEQNMLYNFKVSKREKKYGI